MKLFDELEYWQDDCPRTGAENMAVDQLLLEGLASRPVLRVYEWIEPTVSFGYFLSLDDAREAIAATEDCPLTYVRRWTGGGIVDHRIDLTYTLAIPRGHPVSHTKGAESYRQIHQALADTLKSMGDDVRLTVVDEGDGGLACFSNPVAYDLTNLAGEKIAGAGQRRSRHGMLHQGSVITRQDRVDFGRELAIALAGTLVDRQPGEVFFDSVRELAASRYATMEWLDK